MTQINSGVSLQRHLTIESDTAQLQTVRGAVRQILMPAGVSTKELNFILMSIDEAVMNVIEHAHNFQKKLPIKINFELTDSKFKCSVVSRAPLLDYEEIAEVDLKKHVESRENHGLGIHIMKKFMDEIVTRKIDAGLTELCLIKYLGKRV